MAWVRLAIGIAGLVFCFDSDRMPVGQLLLLSKSARITAIKTLWVRGICALSSVPVGRIESPVVSISCNFWG